MSPEHFVFQQQAIGILRFIIFYTLNLNVKLKKMFLTS